MQSSEQIHEQPKKKGKLALSIILFVVAGVWFMGSIGWYFIYQNIYQGIAEKNTTEYSATVSSVSHNVIYRIDIEEHAAQLSLFWKGAIIDTDTLQNLAVGQTITFRIKNGDKNKLNKAEAIIPVALKVGDTDIITFESSNKHIRKEQLTSTLGFAVAGVTFLALAILCLLWHKEKLGKRKTIPQI
jgi:hypothetical protein